MATEVENVSPTSTDIGGRSEDELRRGLFRAAINGNKRRAKKILNAGLSVNVKNSDGQTPLFCACFEGHESMVELLLKFGADANERTHEGATAVHAACYRCSLKIMERLLEAGGDLRLHDGEGKTPREWALLQDDSKKRKKMIEYLEQTRWFAMTTVGGVDRSDTTLPKKPSKSLSLLDLFRTRSSSDLVNVQSMGFGKFYMNNKLKESSGTASALPIVSEVELVHDDHGATYNCGPFMVMEGMFWNNTAVTAKRLHRNPPEGGCVDLLITEHDTMIQLRHPSILLLMGLCQTNNLEGLVLIYEPVSLGSLYYYMHERLETISSSNIRRIADQIGSALLFMHERNLVHCNVTSHAVQLVTPHSAKLANLQYAVHRSHADEPAKTSQVVHNTYMNAAYNWLPPEIMDGDAPTFMSDVYSYSVLLWEMFTGEIPWCGLSADEIYVTVVEQRKTLPIHEDTIPMPYNTILDLGLQLSPSERQFSLRQMLQALQTLDTDLPLKETGEIPRVHAISVTSPMRSLWSDKQSTPVQTDRQRADQLRSPLPEQLDRQRADQLRSPLPEQLDRQRADQLRSPLPDQLERLKRTPMSERLVSPVKRTPAERDMGYKPVPLLPLHAEQDSCPPSLESETSLHPPPKPARSMEYPLSPRFVPTLCSNAITVDSSASTEDGHFDFIKTSDRRQFFERTSKQRPAGLTVKISTTTTTQPEDSTTAGEESGEELPAVIPPGRRKLSPRGFTYLNKADELPFKYKLHEVLNKRQLPNSAPVVKVTRPATPIRQYSASAPQTTRDRQGQGHLSRDQQVQGHHSRDEQVLVHSSRDHQVQSHMSREQNNSRSSVT